MSSIEIRTYEGDGSDLQELTNRSWRATVGGKALFPLWSQAYFQWRLLDPRGGGRDFLVGAYRGAKLIGCILGEPLSFVVGGRNVRGTLSSWLTVDPEDPSPRSALMMMSAFRSRHREHGMSFSMGFNDAISRRFWETLAKRPPHDVHVLDDVWMWTRIFDGRVVAEAGLTPGDRLVPVVAKLIPGLRPRPSSPVRGYLPGDLPRCHEWLAEQGKGADVRIDWSDARLDLQLNHPHARTIVLEDGGRAGFINYYGIQLFGARPVNVGMIDLFAGTLSFWQQLALLETACRRMKEEGLHMTAMMKSQASPQAVLSLAGFMPYPANVNLFWFFVDPELRIEKPARYHVLFG